MTSINDRIGHDPCSVVVDQMHCPVLPAAPAEPIRLAVVPSVAATTAEARVVMARPADTTDLEMAAVDERMNGLDLALMRMAHRNAEQSADERDAAALAALSATSSEWRTLCYDPLDALRCRLTNRLATRLIPLAMAAAGRATVRAALDGLSAAERRLLRHLHARPTLLLDLESDEARMASWIVSRLSLFGPLLLEDEAEIVAA